MHERATKERAAQQLRQEILECGEGALLGSDAELMKPLEERMANAGDVHIKGPGTDLKFSVKDIPAVGCAGEYNIPDGEVFTAPVKDSVEGTLSVNTPSLYQ